MQLFTLAHAIVSYMLSLPAYRGHVVYLPKCSAVALGRHQRPSQLQQVMQAVIDQCDNNNDNDNDNEDDDDDNDDSNNNNNNNSMQGVMHGRSRPSQQHHCSC